MTQKQIILDQLMKGRTVTPLEALELAGSFRLSERIRELEREGYAIEKGWVKTHSGARVRTYRLAF